MKSIDISYTKKMMIFVSLIIVSWLIMPMLTVLPFVFLCYSQRVNLSKQQRYFVLFMISLSFGLLGFTTESAGTMPIDMERYRETYHYFLPDQSLGELSPINYGFNIVNWILSNYISDNDQTVGLFWVTITYFFTLISVDVLIDKYVKETADFKVVLLFFVILIIPLTQATEMIKQTAAFSVFMYGLSRKMCGFKGGWKWVIVAILVHISALFIVLTYFYDKPFFKKFKFLLLLLSTVFLVVNVTDILMIIAKIPSLEFLDILSRIEHYSELDIFGGSKRYFILFGVYAVTCYIYIAYKWRQKDNLITLFVLSFACLCVTFSNQITFARMLFTWYPFHILLIILMLDKHTVRLYSNRMLYFWGLSLFYVYSNALMVFATLNDSVYSQKYIGGGVINLLTSTVYDFLTYKVTNV